MDEGTHEDLRQLVADLAEYRGISLDEARNELSAALIGDSSTVAYLYVRVPNRWARLIPGWRRRLQAQILEEANDG